MSIRGRLVSFAIRLALKPMLKRDDLSIEALRARLATTDQMSGPIPKGFTSDACELGGVPCRSIAPEALNTQRTLVYFHGGGYVLPGSAGHAQLAAHLGLVGQCRVILVDYRLAPEHPFPAAVEDAMAVFQALHEQGLPSHQLMVGGDSAGGGLAAATLLNLKLQGLPQPAAAVLLSPWLDLALTGGSMQSNADRDVMLGEAVLARWAATYLGERDPLARSNGSAQPTPTYSRTTT